MARQVTAISAMATSKNHTDQRMRAFNAIERVGHWLTQVKDGLVEGEISGHLFRLGPSYMWEAMASLTPFVDSPHGPSPEHLEMVIEMGNHFGWATEEDPSAPASPEYEPEDEEPSAPASPQRTTHQPAPTIKVQ